MAHTNGYAYQHSLNQWEDYMFRCDYDEVMNDIPNFVSTIRKKWETTGRNLRVEQRYSICAGFHHNNIPNDLTRWVAAFAVSHSEKYDYMR